MVQGRDWDRSKLDADAPSTRPSELPRPASPSPPSSPTQSKPLPKYSDTEVWDSVEHKDDEVVRREKELKRKGDEAAKAAAEAAREAREEAARVKKEEEAKRALRMAQQPTLVKGRGARQADSPSAMKSMWAD